MNAQGGWKRLYLPQNSATNKLGCVIEAPNGNLILIGLTNSTLSSNPTGNLTIIGTNSLGDTIWRKNYGSPNFRYLDCFGQRSVTSDNNHFYITTCVQDTGVRQFGVLIKLDFNGDTVWQKIYRDSNPLDDLIPYAVSKSVDGGFLITGFFQNWGSSSYNRCLVIKTDPNGNELWRKKISKAIPDIQTGNAIVQDSASKKIIIVGYQYLGSASNPGTYSNILILDSAGNKLIQTTFSNYDAGVFGEIIQLKDKNFLTCGSMNANNDQGNYPRYNSVVVKFDINANVIWTKTYDTLALYNRIDFLKEHINGDIFMGGILDTLRNYGYPFVSKIKVFRTNNLGEVKWRRYIGSWYNHTFAEGAVSMRTLSNGGFIFATAFPFLPDPKPFSVIKIDSTGCDTLQAYCRMMQEVGISKLTKLFGFQFEVYPNPSSDYVRLKLDAIIGEKFVVQFNDVNGNEVVKYTIKGGSELTVDTSILEQGVYFVSLYCGKNVIDRHKLVIVR